ncbi:MAG: DUF952 domain-containing protein [Myxococcota bacterium]
MSAPAGPILHIAVASQWEAAGETYRPAAFPREGFVHCSLPHQVLKPANRLFRGRTDLVLLVIDPSKLTAELRYEDCYQEGEHYPHVYGPIDRSAVVEVLPFVPNEDGSFELPLD